MLSDDDGISPESYKFTLQKKTEIAIDKATFLKMVEDKLDICIPDNSDVVHDTGHYDCEWPISFPIVIRFIEEK